VNLVCQGRAHLPGLVAQTPLIPAAACWCWLRSKDNDIPGFASLLVNLSSSWCKDYHSYRPHARTYGFQVDLFFQILSSNVYASYYVFPGLCAFSNFSCLSSAFAGGGFICRSEEVIVIAMILSIWGHHERPNFHFSMPLESVLTLPPWCIVVSLCCWKVFLPGTYWIVLSPYSQFQKSMLSHDKIDLLSSFQTGDAAAALCFQTSSPVSPPILHSVCKPTPRVWVQSPYS